LNERAHRFATAINCMDGRTQLPVIEYLKSKYKVDYVDAVTEAGPVKILSDKVNKAAIESIKQRVSVSINVHKSNVIAIVAHYDCAGNPADKATQLKQISKAMDTINSWNNGVLIIGLWIDEDWQITELE